MTVVMLLVCFSSVVRASGAAAEDQSSRFERFFVDYPPLCCSEM